MLTKIPTALLAFFGITSSATLTWISCGTGLDCATLSVSLEYAASSGKGGTATIPLARYKATVSSGERKGSLLVNPGGPGASGKSFVLNGAGESISALTGGFYDIIGWDPRGIGEAEPRLVCFDTVGEEYDFKTELPVAADTSLGELRNASSSAAVSASLKDLDASYKIFADACIAKNSSALFTSTAAYVVRDMAAIVDELDGTDKPLNYWGFSYGTIFGVEFIQTFPERVGRIVLDGVFDAAANAKTYDVQLPNDQISINDAIHDFAALCIAAGSEGCALAANATSASHLVDRIYKLHEAVFQNPVEVSSSSSITVGILSALLWTFFLVPTTWPLIASTIASLEDRDPSTFVAIMSASAASEPSDRSAAAQGSRILAFPPLQCMDNAPSTQLSLSYITSAFEHISLNQNTPWLNADQGPILFCRHGPTTRAQIPNIGAANLSDADLILAAQKTPVLIINNKHDTNTPLASARRLRTALPNSSKLVIREGPGHTTVSIASLGIAKTVKAYFVDGEMPQTDGAAHDVSQLVFDKSIPDNTTTPDPVFNGTYTAEETVLLQATYGVLLSFLAIA